MPDQPQYRSIAMPFDISLLSLLGAMVYIIVAAACISAARTAMVRGQQAWHVRVWVGLGLLFALLVMVRLLDLEELVRDQLRQSFRADGIYRSRGEVQRPLVAAVIALAGAAGIFGLYRATRGMSGRRNLATIAALSCGAAMIMLITLRMVSLHMIDYLLYGLKLNWVLDLGLGIAVIAAAVHYTRVVRGTG